ncbi:sugar ABC transporter ATP-binding protein [Desulfonema ishimotonii]|uniref:Sugar ABC transporter ATP-binding protein n=1 Tax=Desulfonema ishimotonii TaxID=45657 RepID=A0A401FQM0_9BACT|nr:sn-glycerol-3-phosphate ABC transporter ATP-binding protein UgpC [Desulfonema ishimotonii]GBC59271.1 sugar ABC transporter ATP-binding protein [Desulfonema ishimotonii]
MTEVILKNVVKRFGRLEVVHGINLDIHNLEFVVFVGPSGCGKSTTLRMIAGLETISDGEIRIGDRVVNDVAPKDRDVAMVFQNYALYPHMNVFNNMAFGLKLRKTPKAEIEERVREAARILGLTDLLRRKPSELSGGQRQRVAMGRAIVRNPSVFLFDEPLSNLDAKLRNQMRTEIKRLHRNVASTIIYVTHDQVEAMTLADRIVVMRNGHIEQVGAPLELFQKPANTFVAGFIGSPPMTLIPAVVTQAGGGLHLDFSDELRVPVPEKKGHQVQAGQEVIMGLRPQDLTIDDENGRYPDEWKVDALVEFVEPLGSETYLHTDVGGAKFMGRSEGRKLFEVGETVRLTMNLEHLHIFDAESRLSIY